MPAATHNQLDLVKIIGQRQADSAVDLGPVIEPAASATESQDVQAAVAPHLQPFTEAIIPGFGSLGLLTLLSVRDAPQLSTMAAVRWFSCFFPSYERTLVCVTDTTCGKYTSSSAACSTHHDAPERSMSSTQSSCVNNRTQVMAPHFFVLQITPLAARGYANRSLVPYQMCDAFTNR